MRCCCCAGTSHTINTTGIERTRIKLEFFTSTTECGLISRYSPEADTANSTYHVHIVKNIAIHIY